MQLPSKRDFPKTAKAKFSGPRVALWHSEPATHRDTREEKGWSHGSEGTGFLEAELRGLWLNLSVLVKCR